MAETIPSLFSTANRTVPVLVLHGDKSLRRRPAIFVNNGRSGAETRQTAGLDGGDRCAAGGGEEGKGGGDGSAVCSSEVIGGGADGAVEGYGREIRPREYYLVRNGMNGEMSRERRDRMERAGRLDRVEGWEMLVPDEVQVETARWGRGGPGEGWHWAGRSAFALPCGCALLGCKEMTFSMAGYT